MTNKELREILDKVAKEICPDLQLEFMPDRAQMDIFCAYIQIATPILIDKIEVIRNLSNNSAIINLLRMQIKLALLKSKDCIEKELEKL